MQNGVMSRPGRAITLFRCAVVVKSKVKYTQKETQSYESNAKLRYWSVSPNKYGWTYQNGIWTVALTSSTVLMNHKTGQQRRVDDCGTTKQGLPKKDNVNTQAINKGALCRPIRSQR